MIGYLKEKKDEIAYIDEETNEVKVKSFTPLSGLKINYESIPVMNCFELSNMLAGKWISKMFVSNTDKDLERNSYQFTCELHYSYIERTIDVFLRKQCKSITFLDFGAGKVNFVFILF